MVAAGPRRLQTEGAWAAGCALQGLLCPVDPGRVSWPPLSHRFQRYAPFKTRSRREVTLAFLGPCTWMPVRWGHGRWRRWTAGAALLLAGQVLPRERHLEAGSTQATVAQGALQNAPRTSSASLSSMHK